MAKLRCFPEELLHAFCERLEMGTWDWETAWSALERLECRSRSRDGFRRQDVHRGLRIVEALSRHQDKADRLLPLLHRRYRGYERNLMEWLEEFLAELAGRIRLVEAVPILVERMHEDDFDLCDSCETAHEWIGGDEVVRALADQWQGAGEDFRRYAAELLGHIHTDLSVQKCLEFFAAEEDEETKDFLANALLDNFVPEAVEPIRQMVLGGELDPDLQDLRFHLVAAATIMGISFPQYEA